MPLTGHSFRGAIRARISDGFVGWGNRVYMIDRIRDMIDRIWDMIDFFEGLSDWLLYRDILETTSHNWKCRLELNFQLLQEI